MHSRHIELVCEILANAIPMNEVWAFGSRAGGISKPHSDLDLAIITPPEISQTTLVAIKHEFEDSHLPFRVDVLLWNEVDSDFKKVIHGRHVVVQSPPHD